jgi:hypothetical protein
MSGTTARPRSASTVFHRPDGLLLSDPARLLHRAANHGVPGVLTVFRLSPHQTVLPFEVFSPVLAIVSRNARVDWVRRHRPPCLPTLHRSSPTIAAVPLTRTLGTRRPVWGSQGLSPGPGSFWGSLFPGSPADTPLGLLLALVSCFRARLEEQSNVESASSRHEGCVSAGLGPSHRSANSSFDL